MTPRWLSPLAAAFGFAAALVLIPAAAMAEDRVALGWGRLFNNDAIGDTHDRWHTGSYAVSQVRGQDWRGTLPTQPFELLEFRVEANTLAPADLVSPDPGDRRYAGMLSFGVHSQFDLKGIEANFGADMVVTGPQTGVSRFQNWVHNLIGMDDPKVYDDQIANGFYPTLSGELGRDFQVGDTLRLRPFVAASAGVETLVRAGIDLTSGHFGKGAVMLRDGTTGQRYRAVAGDLAQGFSFTFGGDVARVFDSALLPGGAGEATMSESRTRIRAGMQWQGEGTAVFYGLTYLGPEFDQQSQGQFVGSLNLNLRF